jgi:hypothetical protein
VSAHAGDRLVVDPVEDYIDHQDADSAAMNSKPTEVLKMEVDLDGDLKNDVLLALPESHTLHYGYYWTVFHAVSGGYKRLTNALIVFEPSTVYIGKIRSLKKFGVVAYSSGSQNFGGLTAFWISEDQVKEKDLGNFKFTSMVRSELPPAYLRYFPYKLKEGDEYCPYPVQRIPLN